MVITLAIRPVIPKEPSASRFSPDVAPIIVPFRVAVVPGADACVLIAAADTVPKAEVGTHTE